MASSERARRPAPAAAGNQSRRRGQMKKKWVLRMSAGTFAVVAAIAAGAAGASNHAAGLTIKATDKGSSFVINKSVTDTMYFTPGKATIKSGQTLTFEYDGKPGQEPHTITIVSTNDLPKTAAQMNNC